MQDTHASTKEATGRPLVIDLDGTLTPTDIFFEDAFAYLGSGMVHGFRMAAALFKGKAPVKKLVATQSRFDASTIPLNAVVMERIHAARIAGRKVYLATAANESRARAIAKHLGVFDGVFASSATNNLSGECKAAVLRETFGEGNFDYVGNSAADIPIWKISAGAILSNAPRSIIRRVARSGVAYEVLPKPQGNPVRIWLKALRAHHYSKNLLVFLPLLASHSFTMAALADSLVAFLAFCLAASSIYLVNDLIDVSADRSHPTKRNRPLASGAIGPKPAIATSIALLVAALIVAGFLPCAYEGILVLYIALTSAYSLFIKRKLFIDIIVLSMLYTIRVWAGAVAIEVELSNWLITFSLFFFTALALIKRYTELAMRLDDGLANPTNRNYRKEDLAVIGVLAAACGVNSVTIFALYISSETVRSMYAHPGFLWIVCPILLYLLGRMMIMAARREIADDPIVSVINDRIWRLAVVIMVLAFLLAMVP